MATYEAQVNKLIGEDVPAADVTEWMSEGLQTVVNILPEDMLWMLEANTQEYSEADAVHGVSIGTNKILYVQRLSDDYLVDANGDGTLDAKMLVECREVSASLRGRVKAGSGWQEEASQTDPIWYKLGKRIYVEPSPIDYAQSSAVGSEFGSVIATNEDSGSTNFLPNGVYTDTGAQGYEVEVTSSRQDPGVAPVTDNNINRFKWKELPDGTYSPNTNLAMNAMYTYQFTGTDNSWVTVNASETTNDYDLKLTKTAGTTSFESPVISLDGSKNRYISFRMKVSDKDMDTAGGNWYGRLHYKTAGADGHTYSDLLGYIRFDPAVNDTWETFTLDMHQGLNVGDSDWYNNTITQLQFQLMVNKSITIDCDFNSTTKVVETDDASKVRVGDKATASSYVSNIVITAVDTVSTPNTFTLDDNPDNTANDIATTITNDGAVNAEQAADTVNIENFIIGRESNKGVLTVDTIGTNAGSGTWTAGTYTNVSYTTDANGVEATFNITIAGGAATEVVVKNYGNGFAVNETITVLNEDIGNVADGGSLTFDVATLYSPQGTLFTKGVYIVWTDIDSNHTLGDNYEFYAEPSKRSKVYYISNPPTGWAYGSTYLGGVVPKEIDPIVLNYVVARAAEQKLGSIQNGTSASLEQYIIDEDIDLAQAQQVLIQDTHAMIDRYTKEYQMGLQGLMTGTYATQSTGQEKQQPAYSNVAQ